MPLLDETFASWFTMLPRTSGGRLATVPRDSRSWSACAHAGSRAVYRQAMVISSVESDRRFIWVISSLSGDPLGVGSKPASRDGGVEGWLLLINNERPACAHAATYDGASA